METYRALLSPAPPVFSYYLGWVFKEDFRRLIFAVARSECHVFFIKQFLWLATKGSLKAFRVDDRVSVDKPLLFGLFPQRVCLVDSVDIRMMVMTPVLT